MDGAKKASAKILKIFLGNGKNVRQSERRKQAKQHMPRASLHSRVYIIQRPRPKQDGWTPDLTPAAQYGAIDFIFEAGDRPGLDVRHAAKIAAERLEYFDPDQDYLLWPNFADFAALHIVTMLLVASGCKMLKFLQFEKRRDGNGSCYIPLEIDLTDYYPLIYADKK